MASLTSYDPILDVVSIVYDKLSIPFEDTDPEKIIRIEPQFRVKFFPESKSYLKMNSVNVNNFMKTLDVSIGSMKTSVMNTARNYSDHPILMVEDKTSFKSHNILRYAESITISMELLKISDSSTEAKALMKDKQDFQVTQNVEYLLGEGNKILALQECDYEIFKHIQIAVSDPTIYCFFCPREVNVITTYDGLLPTFLQGNPNPFVLSHGTAIFIKMNELCHITTNKEDLVRSGITISTKTNSQLMVHSYKSREAYILCHNQGIGYISCHYNKEDYSIFNLIHMIFDKHNSIDLLYVLGDFNRPKSKVTSAYNDLCTFLDSDGIDHIISISRKDFLKWEQDKSKQRLTGLRANGKNSRGKTVTNVRFTGTRPKLNLTKRKNGQGGKPRKTKRRKNIRHLPIRIT